MLESSSFFRALAALLASLLVGLPSLPSQSAEAGPTISFFGVHGNTEMDSEKVAEVNRWVALSLEDASNVQYRDLDQTGSAVFARRDDVLTEGFLGAARFELIGAQKLFESAQIEEAQASLDRALQLLDRWGEFLRDPQLVVDLYLYNGLCASWTGGTAKAEEWFARAAAVDPERSLDPVRFPEDVIALFNRVKESARRANPASLRIGPEAGAALVILDGKQVGVAPITLDVRPGRHYLAVSHPQKGRAFLTLDAQAGKEVTPRIEFGPGTLQAQREPEEMEGKQSKRTQAVYERLARAAGTDLLLLASFDDTGNFRLQSYSRRDGRFSRPQVADVLLAQKGADEIVGRMVSKLVEATRPDGSLADDAVGTSIAPLYLGRNPVLNDLLLGNGRTTALGTGSAVAEAGTGATKPARVSVARRPWFWAILGGMVAAGAGVGIGFGLSAQEQAVSGDTGVITITFGSSQ